MDDALLLVKPEIARLQMERETRPETPAGTPTSGPGVPLPGAEPGRSDMPASTPSPEPAEIAKLRRYHRTVSLMQRALDGTLGALPMR